MDPDATWATVCDGSLPMRDRREAAVHLVIWLAIGGTPPMVNHLTPRTYVADTLKGVLLGALDQIDTLNGDSD